MSISNMPQPLARLPWRLIFLVMAICTTGLLTLYSAAGGSLSPWALKQGLIIAVSFMGAVFVSYIPEQTVKQFVFPGYLAIVAMLVVVEAIGYTGKGAQRWIDLGIIKLQPSEFMKPVIVLALAYFYEKLPAADVRKWRGLWPAGVLIAIPFGLVFLQPDLGTGLSIVLAAATVMFLAGLPLWYFLSTGAALAVAMPIIYTFVMHDYQRRRVLIFLDPESDPLGAGYHISQSKIAIGSGGVWGKGYLKGSQSHLDFLPEGHTDFVFAAFVEEWGMILGCLLILAFLMLVRWGMRVSQRASTRFGRLTAAGLSTTIFFYFAINLMMVMGMAPVVGIPLPLVSQGGSTVMTVMLCIGIMMGIERQSRSGHRVD